MFFYDFSILTLILEFRENSSIGSFFEIFFKYLPIIVLAVFVSSMAIRIVFVDAFLLSFVFWELLPHY
jgi:hypothetical protein